MHMPPAIGCRSASIPVKTTGIFFFPNALFIIEQSETAKDAARIYCDSEAPAALWET